MIMCIASYQTEQFNKALTIMNRAVTGKTQPPGARENVAYLASTERRRDYESQAAYERREYDVSTVLHLCRHVYFIYIVNTIFE